MTYFESIEQAGQTNIFDYLSPVTEPVIQIGDTAKINIDYCDEEATNYFKYYYPHVINKVGTVINKKKLRDKTLYLIEILGESHWVYESELTIL